MPRVIASAPRAAAAALRVPRQRCVRARPAYFACRRGSGELLVFRNAGECREALVTMKANAP
jgi:hypothetical protein